MDAIELIELAFDSEIFGARMGTLAGGGADASPYRRAIAQAKERGFAHLTCRVDGRDLPRARALQDAGFRLVDVAATLRHPLRVLPEREDAVVVRPATDDDIEVLVEHCATIFRGSRFYSDPFYDPERADELHRRWIVNCHRGGLADVVLVALGGGEAGGFITCKIAGEGVGQIALAGVRPEHRRRGLARTLVADALRWFATRANEVHVRTQAANTSAINLYERSGFHLLRTDLTFAHAPGDAR